MRQENIIMINATIKNANTKSKVANENSPLKRFRINLVIIQYFTVLKDEKA